MICSYSREIINLRGREGQIEPFDGEKKLTRQTVWWCVKLGNWHWLSKKIPKSSNKDYKKLDTNSVKNPTITISYKNQDWQAN